jgi:hypothetical protein
MRYLTRTPLLVLGSILVFSVAVAVVAAPSKNQSRHGRPFHLVMHCWTRVHSDYPNDPLKTFHDNLPRDENAYSVDEIPHPGDRPHRKGNLHRCARNCEDGNRTNLHVTQQVSFATADEMKTFLKNVF